MASSHAIGRLRYLNELHAEWNVAAYALVQVNEMRKTNLKIIKWAWAISAAGAIIFCRNVDIVLLVYSIVTFSIIVHLISEKYALAKVFKQCRSDMKVINDRFNKQVDICDLYELVDTDEFKTMEKLTNISQIFLNTLRRDNIIERRRDR